MDRFDDLDELRDHIWTYMERSIRDRKGAFCTPAIATDGPDVRSIALRQMDRYERSFTFHTDARSEKVIDIEQNPSVVLHAWDAELSQQLRLGGLATLHRDGEVADRLWKSEPDEQLSFYYKPEAPGVELEAPDSGIRPEEVSDEEARENFVAVRIVVDRIFWLHLHPDGEYRARFEWDGAKFAGAWIIP